MKVDDREILFIKRNSPVGFPRLIKEKLDAEGYKVNRTNIHKEISTVKKTYDEKIINAAREIIRTIKGVEYDPSVPL